MFGRRRSDGERERTNHAMRRFGRAAVMRVFYIESVRFEKLRIRLNTFDYIKPNVLPFILGMRCATVRVWVCAAYYRNTMCTAVTRMCVAGCFDLFVSCFISPKMLIRIAIVTLALNFISWFAFAIISSFTLWNRQYFTFGRCG